MMTGYRSMREVLEALEWVRLQMMRRGSPDFIRQRELEGRVRELSARLAHGGGQPAKAAGNVKLRHRGTRR